jgi:hypothetical protein
MMFIPLQINTHMFLVFVIWNIQPEVSLRRRLGKKLIADWRFSQCELVELSMYGWIS